MLDSEKFRRGETFPRKYGKNILKKSTVAENDTYFHRQTLKEALIRFPEAKLTLLHAWSLPGELELGNQAFYAQWRDHEVSRLREALDNEVESLLLDEPAGAWPAGA